MNKKNVNMKNIVILTLKNFLLINNNFGATLITYSF